MPVIESEIGVCTVEEESCAPNSVGIASRLNWRPQETLQKQLPTNFCLSLALLRDADGHRRLVPCGGVELFALEPFFLEASLLGQAIRESNGSLDSEHSQSIDAQRWLFQQRQWLRENFRRSFKRKSDLRIASASGVGQKDILPGTLGCRRSMGAMAGQSRSFLRKVEFSQKRGESNHRTPSHRSGLGFSGPHWTTR
jgi:hypothetical protein